MPRSAEYESPDAKDRAIANLSMKLHDMQSALSDVQSKQAAMEGKSPQVRTRARARTSLYQNMFPMPHVHYIFP